MPRHHDQDALDAARYRWLRQANADDQEICIVFAFEDGDLDFPNAEQADAAIDKAIANEKKG